MIEGYDPYRAKLDPSVFAKACGVNLDGWQLAVLRLRSRRIMLNCCRQSGKSTVASIMVMKRAEFFPRSLVLLVSPSQRQSSELYRKVSEMYRRVYGIDSVEENKTTLELANGSRIVSLPGVEGTIRGFSAPDLVVVDEASMVADEVFYAALLPMLAVSDGAIVLMSTPAGKRGFFHDEWHNGGNWRRFMVEGKDCPRISPEFLKEMRQKMGERTFAQEYECKFGDLRGGAFGGEDIASAFEEQEDFEQSGGRTWIDDW